MLFGHCISVAVARCSSQPLGDRSGLLTVQGVALTVVRRAVTRPTGIQTPLDPIILGAELCGVGFTDKDLDWNAAVTGTQGGGTVPQSAVLGAPAVHVSLGTLQDRCVRTLRVLVAVLGAGARGVGGCLRRCVTMITRDVLHQRPEGSLHVVVDEFLCCFTTSYRGLLLYAFKSSICRPIRQYERCQYSTLKIYVLTLNFGAANICG